MTEQERIEWLIERQKGIGGSDISGILGINQFSSPLNVYLSKVNPVEEFSNKFTKAGIQLENFVAEWFAQESGLPVRIAEFENYTDPLVPYFKASVDRLINDDTVLEIKTTSSRTESPYGSWISQLYWYMGILNKPQGCICWVTLPYGFDYDRLNAKVWSKAELEILKCSCSINWLDYKYDEVYIKQLRDEAHKFWNQYVVPKIPPPPKTAEDVVRLYPLHAQKSSIQADDEIYDIYTQLLDIKQKEKPLKEESDRLSDLLKIFMLDNENLVRDGNNLATFKGSVQNRFNTDLFKKENPELYEKYKKQTPIRTLRLKGLIDQD